LNKRDNIAYLSLALEIAETISMHLKFQIKDDFDFLFALCQFFKHLLSHL